MDICIEPRHLAGTVRVPASKSMAHRAIICAALADGTSHIRGISFAKDIHATRGVIPALGVASQTEGDTITIRGIARPAASAVADCCESGSTLRFLIPVAAALGVTTEFRGQGRLPQRPITPYLREMGKRGVTFAYDQTMPFTISGRLQSGIYELEGDISSQFITGLLFALPLLSGGSEIRLLSRLGSKPYADMTLDCMRRFGVTAEETADGYRIPGGQTYRPADVTVEGDFSQAAFFYAANAMGADIILQNIPQRSAQGDRKGVEILREMWYNKKDRIFQIDASDIPDLVPILSVAAGVCGSTVEIVGAKRLRIKESDRLETTAALVNALGGDCTVREDGLLIRPVPRYHGGTVDSAGDHRIAMSAAIAAAFADGPVIIKGAESVEKSYPAFFEDYQALGGAANGIYLE